MPGFWRRRPAGADARPWLAGPDGSAADSSHAYVLLGTDFGLTPEMALALSVLDRARDFTIGLPGLAAWQLFESGRLWRRATTSAQVTGQNIRPSPMIPPDT